MIRAPRATSWAAALLLAASGCGGEAPPSRPHVLVVSIDTLRADRLGVYGCERGLTPRMDALAARGRTFLAAYTQSTLTHPAMSSVFTGLVPPRHGVRSQAARLVEGVVPLQELLTADGYATGAFVANLCRLAEHPDTVWGRAWGTFFCGEQEGAEQYLWDRAIVDAALAWLEEVDGPTLAWVHFMDPHSEYRPPPEEWDYAARPVPDAAEQSRAYAAWSERWELPPADVTAELNALYDAQVRGVDAQVGRLLDGLAAQGRADDTLVVLLSDHGDELFDAFPKAGHGLMLTEGVLRVPLVLAGPGVARGVEEAPVETLQVAPTVLEVLGLQVPYALDGGSLLAPGASTGAATSFAGSRASVRRDRLRWWGGAAELAQPEGLREYVDAHPYLRRTPWFESNQALGEYGDDPLRPRWLDLDDDGRAAASDAFRRPLRARLSSIPGAAERAIDDPALREALERLGYL